MEKQNTDDTDLLKNTDKNIEQTLNKILDKTKIAVIILIFFIILNLPILNKYLVKCIPRFGDIEGNVNMICIICKGIILSLIYIGSSFCI